MFSESPPGELYLANRFGTSTDFCILILNQATTSLEQMEQESLRAKDGMLTIQDALQEWEKGLL